MYTGSFMGLEESLHIPFKSGSVFKVKMSGILGQRKIEGLASTWIGDITLNGGKALLQFDEDVYKGQPSNKA